MSDYLKRAADLLEKAAAANERHSASGLPRTFIETHERIAKGFALLGAIDKGVLPAAAAEGLYAHLDEVPTATARPVRQ